MIGRAASTLGRNESGNNGLHRENDTDAEKDWPCRIEQLKQLNARETIWCYSAWRQKIHHQDGRRTGNNNGQCKTEVRATI